MTNKVTASSDASQGDAVDEILTKLENAVAYDVQKRIMQHTSGVSPKQSHARAHAAITALLVAEQQNAVAWTIKIIDDQHTHPYATPSMDLDASMDLDERDRTFKGIKNGIRAQYKLETGVDPAPSYPIKATLRNIGGEK